MGIKMCRKLKSNTLCKWEIAEREISEEGNGEWETARKKSEPRQQ